MAITPGSARGQLAETTVRWRFQKNISYIPTPLLYHGVFYMVKTGGIVTALDPAAGKLLKEGRATDALGKVLTNACDDGIVVVEVERQVQDAAARTEGRLDEQR